MLVQTLDQEEVPQCPICFKVMNELSVSVNGEHHVHISLIKHDSDVNEDYEKTLDLQLVPVGELLF